MQRKRELANLLELELKEDLVHIKNFKRLNFEKITPNFLSMAEKNHTNDNLSVIENKINK